MLGNLAYLVNNTSSIGISECSLREQRNNS